MTVTLYQSTDASAPVVNDTAKSVLDAVRAIAVTGYGSQPGAGWSAPFADGTGPDRRVFVPGGGPTRYFRIREGAFGGPNENALDAWETMTDVDTGTAQWLTDARSSGHPNSALGRPWIAVADAETLTFCMDFNINGRYALLHMGGFYGYSSTDAFRSIVYHTDHNMTEPSISPNLGVSTGNTRLTRSHAGILGGINGSLVGDNHKLNIEAGASFTFRGTMPYPNPADGKTWISPLYVGDGAAVGPVIRGKLRGLHAWCHPAASIADRDTFSIGARTFVVVKFAAGGLGVLVLETSSTWPTN